MCLITSAISYLFYRCFLVNRDFEVSLKSRLQGECCICLDEMDVKDKKDKVMDSSINLSRKQVTIGVVLGLVFLIIGLILAFTLGKNSNKKKEEEKIIEEDFPSGPSTPPPSTGTAPPPVLLRAGDSIGTSSDYNRVDLANTAGITYTFTYSRPPNQDTRNSTGFYFKEDEVMSVGFEQLRSENKLTFRGPGFGVVFNQSVETPVIMPLSGVFRVEVEFQGPTQAPQPEGKEIVQVDFFIGDTKYGPYRSFTRTKAEVFEGLGRITSLARLNNFNSSEVDVVLT